MKNQRETIIKETNQDEISAKKEFDTKHTLKHPNPGKKQYSMEDYRKTEKNKPSNTIDIPQDEQQYEKYNKK